MGKSDKMASKKPFHLASNTSLPLHRSINTIAVLVHFCSKHGIETDLLLKGSGIEANDLDDPNILVTPQQELSVIRNIVRLSIKPGLGLLIGKQYHAGVLGKLGAAATHCNTFIEAIQLIFQFTELLLTYFHFDLKIENDLACLKLRELIDLKDNRIFIGEREFASIYRISSNLVGNRIPVREIRVAYPKPEYAAYYQDVFQCPIKFDAEDHTIVVDKSLLLTPLPMANLLSKKMYEKECEELALRIKSQGTLTNRIQQEILFHKDEFPGFNQLARYMNFSPRTLRRRLAEEGTSYRELVAGLRENRAIHLLQTTDLSIGKIAINLGYSDLSNFHRAFKSWTGHTPNHYR